MSPCQGGRIFPCRIVVASNYRNFVSSGSSKESFRALFLALGDPVQLPTLFHCTTGKDRTGRTAGLGIDAAGQQALRDL